MRCLASGMPSPLALLVYLHSFLAEHSSLWAVRGAQPSAAPSCVCLGFMSISNHAKQASIIQWCLANLCILVKANNDQTMASSAMVLQSKGLPAEAGGLM